MLLLVEVTAAIAIPSILSGLDDARAFGAARHLAAMVRGARAQAAMRSRSIGLRFERDGSGYRYALFVDGNGNGLRASDVHSGRDQQIGDARRLREGFPGVSFGFVSDASEGSSMRVRGAEPDPIRLGLRDVIVFSPFGTGTSGTLYVRSRSGRQYAVRVFGGTGRTRVLEFRRQEGSWVIR